MHDGTVLLSQGSGKDNKPLANGELFDHGRRGFSKLKAGQVEALLVATQSEALDPKLTGSIPSDGTTGVAADALLALRFSKPLRAETISAETSSRTLRRLWLAVALGLLSARSLASLTNSLKYLGWTAGL
ncbi:MAG: Ig-like domain-containing protein [Acidobacteriota bacterium]